MYTIQEAKQKSKRILLEKLGSESVEWGHNNPGNSGKIQKLGSEYVEWGHNNPGNSGKIQKLGLESVEQKTIDLFENNSL